MKSICSAPAAYCLSSAWWLRVYYLATLDTHCMVER